MSLSPLQALGAINRPVASNAPSTPHRELLIVGATGALGHAALHRLVGLHRFAHTRVLAREPMQRALHSVSLQVVTGAAQQWPLQPADVAIVMFDPPRSAHGRERALYAPTPQELPALAAWLRRCGVRTLAVVLPHAQGTLPDALKRGLANLDEQQIAALDFETLLILRSARKPGAAQKEPVLKRLASAMLGIMAYMVPSQEQPVRASRTARLLDVALAMVQRESIHGVHVASPEIVWQASQGGEDEVLAVAQRWLMPAAASEDQPSR